MMFDKYINSKLHNHSVLKTFKLTENASNPTWIFFDFEWNKQAIGEDIEPVLPQREPWRRFEILVDKKVVSPVEDESAS